MTIILLIFCFISLYKIKFCADNIDYISRNQTQRINGFFVFLIFMSHFVTYIDTSTIRFIGTYLDIRFFLKQLVVVTFLFFSGYGMFESFKGKGEKYIDTIPNRFLKLLLRFDVAVLLFLITNLIIGQEYSLKWIFLSFLGWNSIGNSNWYVFVVLGLYVIMYVVFKILKCKSFPSLVGFTVGSVLFIFVLMKAGKIDGWYNTILSFTAGMWFSYYRQKFELAFKQSKIFYICGLSIVFLFFMICHQYMFDSLLAYEFMGVFFCLSIVFLSKKIYSGNPVLLWLGNHTFSVYILQRIPMILGKQIGLDNYFVIYFVICLLVTIVISYFFDIFTYKLESYIFK